MATAAQQVPATTSIQHSDEHRGVSRGALLLIALVVITVAAVAWLIGNASPTSSLVPGAADPMAPYRPGGSVYEMQVPEAAADPLAANRPGGSAYEQQVPEAAR